MGNPAFAAFARSEIEQSIPSRFEAVARRDPGRLAVRTGDSAFSYDELNRFANRIAHAIRARRDGPAEAIVLLVEQGPALVAATLAVLKSGHFYVPLDRSHPLPRLAAMVRDAACRLVVCDDAHLDLADALHAAGPAILHLDDIAGHPDVDPVVVTPAGALAYVYYTSGSTGEPKGVMDSHRNVLHNVMRYTNALRIAADDRLTLLQSASFSGAVSSTFAALLNGAAVFPFDLTRRSPAALAEYLIGERITIYHSVPAVFRSFLTGTRSFPDVRLIRLEGDQAWRIDLELHRRHFEPSCVLVNGLGATETGIVRQYFVDRTTPLPAGPVPIGHPVEDMAVTLVDEAGSAVGTGMVGEITVRSRFLSPGYWRNPELTARAFDSDPGDATLRTYRTGDLGRMRADGCLEHLGRKDFRELGPDQPFYALTPCGADGGPVPASIQAMVDRHLEAIRSVQPAGPYHLAGNCNGGLVALELARRLIAAGDTVPVLVLVRTSASNARFQRLAKLSHSVCAAFNVRPQAEARLTRHLRWYADAIRGASPAGRVAITAAKLRHALVALAPRDQFGRAGTGGAGTALLASATAAQVGRLADAGREQLADTYMRLAADYVPARFPGRATVLWPAEDDEPPAEAERAWRQVVQELEFRVIPGSHLSYVTRHVAQFAARLRDCLRAGRDAVR